MTSKVGVAGQMFSGEFLIAFMIFLIAVILMISIWSNQTSDILLVEKRINLEESGVEASEKLLRTGGEPFFWNSSNVSSFGLANESRELMVDKILSFVELTRDNLTGHCSGGSNYECNLYLLGMGGNQFLFNLTDLGGATLNLANVSAVSGRPPENVTESVTITRTAILDGDIVRLYFTVWR